LGVIDAPTAAKTITQHTTAMAIARRTFCSFTRSARGRCPQQTLQRNYLVALLLSTHPKRAANPRVKLSIFMDTSEMKKPGERIAAQHRTKQ
jgi:hypothetical protein